MSAVLDRGNINVTNSLPAKDDLLSLLNAIEGLFQISAGDRVYSQQNRLIGLVPELSRSLERGKNEALSVLNSIRVEFRIIAQKSLAKEAVNNFYDKLDEAARKYLTPEEAVKFISYDRDLRQHPQVS